SSLARALCWAAAWDMLRDAELAARDYVALVLTGLPAESDINLVTATLRQAGGALAFYSDPEWAPIGGAQLADTARTAMLAAPAGSGFQLAWARAFASAARSDEHLALLRGWLSGDNVPAGLPIDTEFRWSLLGALVANGAASSAEIDAELANDRTSSGEREAAEVQALIPTAENKASVWRHLTGSAELPNWRNRALLSGFQHPAQVDLIAPYAAKFFESVVAVWGLRDSEPAQEFVVMAYPTYTITDEVVAAADAWLAEPGHPAALRRLVAEGRDSTERALRARLRDAAAR
ncbi:MAG TPA: ERAP1-like C-terminal domain-containing protein, partial [Asanoa sp.]|nr:ERAP1-like C-terminal domain-containing protein [Asanoa sp.]